MNTIERAKRELKLAGYNPDFDRKDIKTTQDYADQVAHSVVELLEVFSKQGHSGMSANFTLQLFDRLVRHKALTELTDNPEEWEDMTEQSGRTCYQSNRQPSCFSEDMKTYYDIDDPDNNIYEKDENGEYTGYATLKQKQDRKFVELKHYEPVK